MATPTTEHKTFFKNLANDPAAAKAFVADPKGSLTAAGLDSAIVSDEHHTALSGGANTVTKVVVAASAVCA